MLLIDFSQIHCMLCVVVFDYHYTYLVFMLIPIIASISITETY